MFGVLLWTVRPVPLGLLVIPVLWALMGVVAAVRLEMLEDLGLLVAALVGTDLLLFRARRPETRPVPITEPPSR